MSWSLPLISLTLNHTFSLLLPDNFFNCSQTPNSREFRGFRDNFRHSLQRQRLKDALEDVGVLPKCTVVWTHTGALSSRCYSCVADTKMMFLPETPDADASSRNCLDDMMTLSSEDANDAQWYDSLQLWYLFRRTLWQQDVSLSKALAQPIPSLQDMDLLPSVVPTWVSKPVLWQLMLSHTFYTVPWDYFTFYHQNSSQVPNLLLRRESLIDEDKKRKGQDKLEGLVASNSRTSTPHRLVPHTEPSWQVGSGICGG